MKKNELPKIKKEKIEKPKVVKEKPEKVKKIKEPKVKEPKVKVKAEKVKMPKVKTPKTKTPKVKMPKVKKNGNSKAENKLFKSIMECKPVQVFRDKVQGSIRTTLMASFALPVLLIVILGIVSYNIASSVVLTKYKESAVSTVGAVSNYFDVVCDTVSSKALDMIVDKDIKDYFSIHTEDNSSDAITLFKSARTVLMNAPSTNAQLYSVTAITKDAKNMSSIPGSIPNTAYDEFMQSEEGQLMAANASSRSMWLGDHSYLDGLFDSNTLDSTLNQYCLVLYQRMAVKDALLVLDINMNVFDEMIANMDFGKGSIKAIVSQDGREVARLHGKEEAPESMYFVGHDYYDKVKDATEPGVKDVRLKGKRYVYVYAPVGETGVTINALIPRSNLVAEVNTIKYITVFIVVLSVVLALFVGLMISNGIGNTVLSMSKGLAKLEQGDFTNEFQTKRRDEFATLTKSLNSMLMSLKTLMKDMKSFGFKVTDMSSSAYKYAAFISLGK